MKDVGVAESPYDKIQKKWAEANFQGVDQQVFCWLSDSKVESPIEKIMGTALAVNLPCCLDAYCDTWGLVGLRICDDFFDKLRLPCLFELAAQVGVESYRADFMVRCSLCPDRPIVIECDGHDFHEKTKQQAARDKKRDRVLQSSGFAVLRFTGSEIFRDPVGCVEEVYSYFCKMVGEGDESAGLFKMHEKAQELWKKLDS